MIYIDADELTEFATSLLVAGGVYLEDAEVVAGSLVASNLKGHDSHGVMRIPSYLEKVRKGEVVSGADFTVLKETPVLLMADANWGFGQVQARRLTQRLIEKSRSTGIALGTMVRSIHTGRVGEYCEIAAEAGLASTVMVNTHGNWQCVAPPGGKQARLGTNVIAYGLPNGSRPVIFDFTIAAAPQGKVRLKKISGEKCPDGWLLDADGRPTNDPNALYRSPPGTIRPLGGDQSYKGFGLGLVAEFFAGALAGGVCTRETPINQKGNCVFMQFIDPAQLAGAERFAKTVADATDYIRDCPRIDGVDEILLPGDVERRALASRTADGIPFDARNWSELVDLASGLGVTVPSTPAAEALAAGQR